MYKINALDVNEALAGGLALMINEKPEISPSRNGKVLRMKMPVVTVTTNALNRVLFSPMRNANPFFHFMESLWMLSGRNDLPWLAQFNRRMAEYSDDGGATQPGAYGHRWINHFGSDQIVRVVERLRKDPSDRRCVISMWDGFTDPAAADAGSADVPCNTHIYLRVVNGCLDMTVCCRSNDLWWGAHGANAVHFSILQEYIAAACDIPAGVLYQMSNDYHLYTDIIKADLVALAQDCTRHNLYIAGAKPTQLFYDNNEVNRFNNALPLFMDFADPAKNPVRPISADAGAERETWDMGSTGVFSIDGIAYPMLRAWDCQKQHDYGPALTWANTIGRSDNCDWRVACVQWIKRKQNRQFSGSQDRKAGL
jgi:thymidylate synthase